MRVLSTTESSQPGQPAGNLRSVSSPWPSYEEVVRRTGRPAVAVVFGVGHYQGMGVLRGLGRMGVPVVAIGEKDSVGFWSRYACESHVSPDPHEQPEEFLRLLVTIGRRLKAEGKNAVLFPTRDSVVELFAKRCEELREFFICHSPDYEVIRNCSNKEAQIRLARELNVPAPQTYFDNELDSLHRDLAGGRLQFPLILKAKKELPTELKKKFRLIILNNDAQLRQALADAAAQNIAFLIQEVISGEDDQLYTFGSCLARNGKLTAVFTGRKLRQQPPRFGVCRVGESVPVEPIVRDGERLLRGLKFHGISQVEYKFDARDGRYKLMEVNPRAWAWIGLAVAMGVNIPYAFFCDALGVDISPQSMPSLRGVYISLYDDLYWSLKARDGRAWAHCFKDYDLIVEPFYSRDDRMPGLIHFTRCGVLLAQMGFNQVLRALGLRR